MRNVLEYDINSNLITNLGIDQENMYKEANSLVNLELAEQLKRGNLSYYMELMKNKQQVSVRFSGFRERNGGGRYGRSDELFVLFDTIELVYPVERFNFSDVPDAKELLEKEYKVFVSKVDEKTNRVYLTDMLDATRQKFYEMINQKLEEGEPLYLRGNIVGLQNERLGSNQKLAAFVNIGGLGIIGVIPIKQWSVGYSALDNFHSIIMNNVNAIVNFRVVSETRIKYGNRTKTAFLCSRSDYLKKIGYDPWRIVSKTLSVRSVVKVKVIENGKSPESFFASIDGVTDFNMICYIDDASDLTLKDITLGKYYYGYVQKMNPEKKFLRVRLTSEAEQGSLLKVSDTKTKSKK